MTKRLFVTGTDTGIGKTWVTAVLVSWFLRQGQRVTVFKPVQTGVGSLAETDPAQVARWLGPDVTGFHWACGLWVEPPAAPSVAVAPGQLDPQRLLEQADTLAQACDVLIVEGAGGVLVPLNGETCIADLIQQLGAEAIVVARPNLGTINHTLLTVEALQRRGIPVAGVILNESQPMDEHERQSVAVQTVLQELEHWLSEVTVLGWLAFQKTAEAGCLAPFSSQAQLILAPLECNKL